MPDPIEAERAALVEAMVSRYLADEIDRQTLADLVEAEPWLTVWPPDARSRLALSMVSQHLFLFDYGDWSEDVLRTSLGQILEWLPGDERLLKPLMFDSQWASLVVSGVVPPGMTLTHTVQPSPEEFRELVRSGKIRPRRRRYA